MSEKTQNAGGALVLRDPQGVLSWVEIGSSTDPSVIIIAREKQGYSVFDITTTERAKQLVNPSVLPTDEFSQFRR